MFKHQGIWLPAGEAHFPDWMTKHGELVDGRGTYQIKKFRKAMEYCRGISRAVDVGAHVGLWSMHMAKKFAFLSAFEPVEQFRACWDKNLMQVDGCIAKLYPYALGAAPGHVVMNIPALNGGIDTGGTHVAEISSAAPLIEMRTMDSFGWLDVDFIKIDCEGYEHHVIKGARETIARCKPCIIVEQKPHKLLPNFGIKGTPGVDMLTAMGAVVRAEISGDYILSWD